MKRLTRWVSIRYIDHWQEKTIYRRKLLITHFVVLHDVVQSCWIHSVRVIGNFCVWNWIHGYQLDYILNLVDLRLSNLNAVARQDQTCNALIINVSNVNCVVNIWVYVGLYLGDGQSLVIHLTITWIADTRHIFAHILAFAETMTELKAATRCLNTMTSGALQWRRQRAAQELEAWSGFRSASAIFTSVISFIFAHFRLASRAWQIRLLLLCSSTVILDTFSLASSAKTRHASVGFCCSNASLYQWAIFLMISAASICTVHSTSLFVTFLFPTYRTLQNCWIIIDIDQTLAVFANTLATYASDWVLTRTTLV